MKLCVIMVVSWLIAMCNGAAAVPEFKIGIEFPSQVPVSPAIENALQAMGIGYMNYFVTNSTWDNPGELPAAEVNKAKPPVSRGPMPNSKYSILNTQWSDSLQQLLDLRLRQLLLALGPDLDCVVVLQKQPDIAES